MDLYRVACASGGGARELPAGGSADRLVLGGCPVRRYLGYGRAAAAALGAQRLRPLPRRLCPGWHPRRASGEPWPGRHARWNTVGISWIYNGPPGGRAARAARAALARRQARASAPRTAAAPER